MPLLINDIYIGINQWLILSLTVARPLTLVGFCCMSFREGVAVVSGGFFVTEDFWRQLYENCSGESPGFLVVQMNITLDEIKAKLLEILIGPPKLTQRAMAKKIGINHIRLNHFLKGRDHADRNTPNTTIGGEALEAVLRYLRTEHSWPPPFDAREALNKLKSKIPTTRRTIREDFIDKLGDGFIITAIDRRGIEAEDSDGVMLPYRPIGGLTQEDYDAFLPYLTPEDQEDFRLFLGRTTEE